MCSSRKDGDKSNSRKRNKPMTKELDTTKNITKLYKAISSILNTARANAYNAVNFAMVSSYWSIGQLIVEDEQTLNTEMLFLKVFLKNLQQSLEKALTKVIFVI